jgi:rRNA maturation protein Nop10
VVESSYIKCPKCNTRNKDTDYCTNCGEIINIVLKRRLEIEDKQNNRIELKKIKGPDKIERMLQKASQHPNSIVRALFSAAYLVWTFFAMVIGALIAMVIAIAAG